MEVIEEGNTKIGYRIPVYGCISTISGIEDTCRLGILIESDGCLYCSNICINDTSESVVPIKCYTITDDNKNNSVSRFCDGAVNNQYKIYDGDLPLIDISLLCKHSSDIYICKDLIEYTCFQYNNDGSFSYTGTNDSALVCAKDVCKALDDAMTSANEFGTGAFWTEPVKVTT